MYFGTKSYLKSNRYHTAKYTLNQCYWVNYVVRFIFFYFNINIIHYIFIFFK